MEGLDKKVLDCGAGGNMPPLHMFQSLGYETYGIEIDEDQLNRADEYQKENDVDLNIQKGDMRELPFEDGSISYAFSYNAIFHMKKEDIRKSLMEIKRVLPSGGLCFFNVLSKEDCGFGEGEALGDGEFYQEEGGSQVIHSYFDYDELDEFLCDFTILMKERRLRTRIYNDEFIDLGYIDYIIKKK